MSTSWQKKEYGTFEVVDRQGMVGKIFGGFMLFFAGCFLYWLGTALIEYARFGTWQDILAALPGMTVDLFMAALFGVPGLLMALLKTRTLCNKSDGLIRHVKSVGPFYRVKEIKISSVRKVAATFKISKTTAARRRSIGAQIHMVELVLADRQRVEVAQLGKWDSALNLGRQLAGYLNVEFQG